jgi:hypothetical protein
MKNNKNIFSFIMEVYIIVSNSRLSLFPCHLGIRPSDNSPSKKVPPLNEGVGSISRILKKYTCMSLDYNLYHI